MTQTQANDDGAGSTNTTRRGFVRLGIGATAAATAGIGAGSSPAAAQSCDPEQSLSCSYGDQPDFGVSYLIGRIKKHFTGLGDETTYSDKQADQLFVQFRQDLSIIMSENERTLVQAANLMASARSAFYQVGREVLLEELNNGTDFANAKIKAEEAITAEFVPTQKNVIERWNVMALQLEMAFDRAANLSGSSKDALLRGEQNHAGDTYGGSISLTQKSITLLDESTMEIDAIKGSLSSNWGFTIRPDGMSVRTNSATNSFTIFSPGNSDLGYGSKTFLTRTKWMDRWQSLMTKIETTHDEAISNFRAFANGIQDKYVAGDIDTEDIVSPRDLWEMGSENSENPLAAADLAGLGLEVNQKSSVVIKLLTDDNQIEGSVYLSESPIGESITVGNVYDPNLSRQTDADGNHTDSASDYAATESDPIPLDGLTFIAYNTDDGSTYDQIQQPFEVVNAFNEDGEELQDVTYEPAPGQQTTTTDIDELRKELQSMNDEIKQIEEERAELATGGGGGVFGGSDGGVIAAAAAAGALLFVLLGGGGGS